MKIYVASSWRNAQQPEVIKTLQAAGFEVYDFRNPRPGIGGFGWRQVRSDPPPWNAIQTRMVLGNSIAQRGFSFDYDAMRWADAVVMLQPCGVSAALELGWFAGTGKLSIVLLADGQEPELMLRLADYLCVSLSEVVDILKVSEPASPSKVRGR